MKEFFDDKKCENKFVGILINDRKKRVLWSKMDKIDGPITNQNQ
jgi:hypothetical protein